VITGDENGFSWTCSVISSILDESVIAQCTKDITDILEMFINQQYSGRSLVFVVFLGHICEKLARDTEHFLHTLDKIMDMDVSIYQYSLVSNSYTHVNPAKILVRRYRLAEVPTGSSSIEDYALGYGSTSHL